MVPKWARMPFCRTMRDFNDGESVESLFLEHYPEMAEKMLSDIRAEAVKRWELDEALIVHRVGRIYPGDAIVLVATWASHRAHASRILSPYDGDPEIRCSVLEKERLKKGERWVTKNTSGVTSL